MLHFLLGTAVIVLPRGNLALLGAIGAAKAAGASQDITTSRSYMVLSRGCGPHTSQFADPPDAPHGVQVL